MIFTPFNGPSWPHMAHPSLTLIAFFCGMGRFLENSSTPIFKARYSWVRRSPDICMGEFSRNQSGSRPENWNFGKIFAFENSSGNTGYKSSNLPWWKWNFWSKSPYSCAIFSLSWYLKWRFRIYSFLNRCVLPQAGMIPVGISFEVSTSFSQYLVIFKFDENIFIVGRYKTIIQ